MNLMKLIENGLELVVIFTDVSSKTPTTTLDFFSLIKRNEKVNGEKKTMKTLYKVNRCPFT